MSPLPLALTSSGTACDSHIASQSRFAHVLFSENFLLPFIKFFFYLFFIFFICYLCTWNVLFIIFKKNHSTVFVRYTSLTTTISHDNNNHRTSKHASTSWRSDGSPSCPDGGVTRVGPGQNPQYTRALFGGEAVVAEQVLRDLSVRRASVCVCACSWSVQTFLM